MLPQIPWNTSLHKAALRGPAFSTFIWTSSIRPHIVNSVQELAPLILTRDSLAIENVQNVVVKFVKALHHAQNESMSLFVSS